MSNLIKVNNFHSSPAITTVSRVWKKRNRLRKNYNIKNLPLFSLMSFEALIDGVVNLMEAVKNEFKSFHEGSIFIWQSMTKEAKIAVLGRKMMM